MECPICYAIPFAGRQLNTRVSAASATGACDAPLNLRNANINVESYERRCMRTIHEPP